MTSPRRRAVDGAAPARDADGDRGDRRRAADWRRPRGPLDARGSSTSRRCVFLLIVGLGPLLWLAKSSITPTQDTLRTPMALWPNGFDLGQPRDGLEATSTSTATSSTRSWIAAGSWLVQLVVATTAGFALSVLRPRFARDPHGLVLATLFVPAGRAAGAALPDHPRRAARALSADQHVSGRSGCRPARARSTSS